MKICTVRNASYFGARRHCCQQETQERLMPSLLDLRDEKNVSRLHSAAKKKGDALNPRDGSEEGTSETEANDHALKLGRVANDPVAPEGESGSDNEEGEGEVARDAVGGDQGQVSTGRRRTVVKGREKRARTGGISTNPSHGSHRRRYWARRRRGHRR